MYEDMYLKKYENVQDLLMGLTHYFLFYNDERRHQSLDYQTPDVVYRTAAGGAKIMDVPSAKELGQRHAAVHERGSILNLINICLDSGAHFS